MERSNPSVPERYAPIAKTSHPKRIAPLRVDITWNAP